MQGPIRRLQVLIHRCGRENDLVLQAPLKHRALSIRSTMSPSPCFSAGATAREGARRTVPLQPTICWPGSELCKSGELRAHAVAAGSIAGADLELSTWHGSDRGQSRRDDENNNHQRVTSGPHLDQLSIESDFLLVLAVPRLLRRRRANSGAPAEDLSEAGWPDTRVELGRRRKRNHGRTRTTGHVAGVVVVGAAAGAAAGAEATAAAGSVSVRALALSPRWLEKRWRLPLTSSRQPSAVNPARRHSRIPTAEAGPGGVDRIGTIYY